MFGLFDKKKTFRPSKQSKYKNDRLAELKQNYATLGGGHDMRDAVKLPQDESLSNWLAINTVDVFNEINLIYGTIQEQCTNETCPCMVAGTFTYLWQDQCKYQQPTELSAPQYVEHLLTWAESQINDDSIFSLNGNFPKDFKKRVSTIYRRFFRVYAHIYHHHLDSMKEMGAEAHLNTLFQHFYLFSAEFDLLPEQELEPLQDVIDAIIKKK